MWLRQLVVAVVAVTAAVSHTRVVRGQPDPDRRAGHCPKTGGGVAVDRPNSYRIRPPVANHHYLSLGIARFSETMGADLRLAVIASDPCCLLITGANCPLSCAQGRTAGFSVA
jgi:hypothetical protein